jgi:hypothetical protein
VIEALYADPTPMTVHIYPSLGSCFVSVIDDSEVIPDKEIQLVLAKKFHSSAFQAIVERRIWSAFTKIDFKVLTNLFSSAVASKFLTLID